MARVVVEVHQPRFLHGPPDVVLECAQQEGASPSRPVRSPGRTGVFLLDGLASVVGLNVVDFEGGKGEELGQRILR